MKATFALLILISPVYSANQRDQLIPFRVYTIYEREPSASMQTSIREEVDKIFGPLGWNLDWKSLYRDTGLVSIKQATLRFKGECTVDDLTEYPPYVFTLGRTQMSMGSIAPFAVIFCDAIRASVAHELLARRPADRNAAFGRAVGRVIAHELYHIFCNTRAHTSKGLSRAYLSPQDLTAEESLYFRKNEAAKLRMLALRCIGEWNAFQSSHSLLPAPAIVYSGGAGNSGQGNPDVFSPTSSGEIGADSK